MGLFEKVFGRWAQKVALGGFFKSFTVYAPEFTSWGGEIYESQLVRAAVHTRATHISKLSIEISGAAKPKLQTKLRAGPNEWQTWGQFLYRLSTILDVQTTAFIVPVLDEYGEPSGIYPLLPTRCTVMDVDGEPWLRYKFSSGKFAAIEMRRCGIMTKYQYEDDFFGSGNRALTPTMEMINIQEQGISEAVKAGGTYRFMARVSNFSTDKDLAKEQKRFTKENLTGEGGVLLFPNTYSDIKQIDSKPYVVDAEEMKNIRESVFDYFGVNSDVMQNKAYGDAWDAFYEGAIEPFAVQLSEVLTKMLFTERERAGEKKSFIMATANRLQYMSVKDKIAFCRDMGDRGLIMIDEGRAVFNMAPLPDGKGQQAPVRGEYYFLTPGQKGGTEDGNNGEE